MLPAAHYLGDAIGGVVGMGADETGQIGSFLHLCYYWVSAGGFLLWL